jgi:glutathione S-transferase
MVTVHHLNNSRSQRVLWLLEEMGVPYEVQRYERDPKTMLAPPALLAVHPPGKSPVITDEGITVAESGAILEYLLERYGKGNLIPPPGSAEFTAADVQMSFPLEAAQSRAGLDASRPNLMGFLSRIHVCPAYQRALVNGCPYAFVQPD